MRTRTNQGTFKRQYTRADIISYLKGATKVLRRSPVYRDLRPIPGPSPTTVIRKFGSWARALKIAGIRPRTHQLFRHERAFIRKQWKHLPDKAIAKQLEVPLHVIRYYRLNYKLWKNSRKGDGKMGQKLRAMRLYGRQCEICSLPIIELHHVIPRKSAPANWTILCSLCHAAITRRLVIVKNRKELKTKLLPFMKKIYSSLRFRE